MKNLGKVRRILSFRGIFLVHRQLLNKLKEECGTLLIIAVLRYISTSQQKERINSIKMKNYELKRLIQTKTLMSNYKVPIINLSDSKLSET